MTPHGLAQRIHDELAEDYPVLCDPRGDHPDPSDDPGFHVAMKAHDMCVGHGAACDGMDGEEVGFSDGMAMFRGGSTKSPAKPGHSPSAKPGGCGSGAGGFKAGNTCGHGSNRNQKVEAARAAHTQAKAEVLTYVKAHRAASKAAAKSGESAPHPKELHAAIKKAAAAHRELKAARDTHRAEQRDKRNASAKERRAVKSGKAQPLSARPKAPSREGQARPSQTDRPARNDRLAVLAARHDNAAKRLSALRDTSARNAYTRQSLAGRGNVNPESPTERGRYADSRAIGMRAQIHKETAERLRESIHDPAKSGAAARTLKSLGNNPVGSRANVDAIRNTAGKLTHKELAVASESAGVGTGGARNRHELRDHLLRTVGKSDTKSGSSLDNKTGKGMIQPGKTEQSGDRGSKTMTRTTTETRGSTKKSGGMDAYHQARLDAPAPKFFAFTPEHHKLIDAAKTRGKRIDMAPGGGMITGAISGPSRDETIIRAAKNAKKTGKVHYVSATYNGWAAGTDRPPSGQSHYVVTGHGFREMTANPTIASRQAVAKKLREQRRKS